MPGTSSDDILRELRRAQLPLAVPRLGASSIENGAFGSTIEWQGGSFGLGGLFQIDALGRYREIHSFNGSDGADPRAGL